MAETALRVKFWQKKLSAVALYFSKTKDERTLCTPVGSLELVGAVFLKKLRIYL